LNNLHSDDADTNGNIICVKKNNFYIFLSACNIKRFPSAIKYAIVHGTWWMVDGTWWMVLYM